MTQWLLQVLISLVLLYVSPFTAGNQELRQCLAYFLPAYSYSSRIQQDRMRSVWIDPSCSLSYRWRMRTDPYRYSWLPLILLTKSMKTLKKTRRWSHPYNSDNYSLTGPTLPRWLVCTYFLFCISDGLSSYYLSPDEGLDAQSTHVRLAIDLAKVLYDSERTRKNLCPYCLSLLFSRPATL